MRPSRSRHHGRSQPSQGACVAQLAGRGRQAPATRHTHAESESQGAESGLHAPPQTSSDVVTTTQYSLSTHAEQPCVASFAQFSQSPHVVFLHDKTSTQERSNHIATYGNR